jgi:hypothetical protein
MSRIAFFIVALHMSVIGYTWYYHHLGDVTYDPWFYAAFLHASPIMVMFNLLSLIGANYGGRFSAMLGIGLALAVVKYGSLFFAIRKEGFSGLNMATVAIEVGYIASSGYYLAQLNII